MTDKQILELIQPLNPDEQFYRDYYQAGKSQARLKQFLASVNRTEIIRRHLVVPEISPDIISYNMEDAEYFSEGNDQSVYISRHNRYTPAFRHKHAFFEVVYVQSGHCAQTIGLQRLPLASGDICLIAPGTLHTIEVFDDDSLVFNVLLRGSTFYDMFMPLTKGHHLLSEFFAEGLYTTKQIQYLIFHTGNDPVFHSNILRMYGEQMEADAYTDQILVGTLTASFAYLMRNYGDTVESSLSTQSVLPDDFLIINYIQDHLAEVTLADVSKEFGFSISHCSRIIKASTGQNFNDWKRTLRLRRAEYLLIGSHFTVAEISDKLGYKNPETFIRAFQREFHVSPAQYRKKAAE